MRTKVTLVLVFLNVALFFFIFKFERPWLVDAQAVELRRRVLGAEAADIRSLEISGGTPVHTLALAKRGDTWFVTQPLEWPANPAAVSRILTELQFLEHIASFKVSELAQNGQSLADYGLDHPKLTIAITSGDPAEHPQVTRLQIGDLTKDGLRLYVLSPDGERVHVVSQSLAQSVGLSPDDLRTDALFTIPVFEARSLNLQTAAPASLRIRLRRDGSKWSFETPIIARASKTATELAINGLNGLRVTSFITTNPPATLPSANPSLKITLEGNNRRETLILGGLVRPDAPDADEYYAQLEGRSALFTVRIPSGPKSLMTTLRTAQASLRETHILDFDAPAVTAVTINAPNQPELILQRLETGTQASDNSAWQIVRRGEATVGPQTQPADRSAVQRLLDQLSRLAVDDFNTGFKSDAPTAADLESWGFNRPEREVLLTLGGAPALSLQLGTDAKHNVYARLGPVGPAANPSASIYSVDAEILRELPIAPRAWRDRLLRELPAGARLTALKLTDLTTNQAVVDVALDDTGHPPAGTKNPEAIATVLTSLRTLRAKEFILDRFADKVTVAGEDRPWRYRLEATATLVGGAGEQTSVTKLFLTSRVGGDQQLAGSPANEYDAVGAVFSIEQPLLDALFTLTEAAHDPGPIPPPATVPGPAPAPSPAPVPAPATPTEPTK